MVRISPQKHIISVISSLLLLSQIASSAVIYVTQPDVVKTVTPEAKAVYMVVTASNPEIVTVDQTVQETEIIYQAKTVHVTSIRTTVITTIQTMEPNKVVPAKTGHHHHAHPQTTIPTQISSPKAVYPITATIGEPSASVGEPATIPAPEPSVAIPVQSSTLAFSTGSAPPSESQSTYSPSPAVPGVSSSPSDVPAPSSEASSYYSEAPVPSSSVPAPSSENPIASSETQPSPSSEVPAPAPSSSSPAPPPPPEQSESSSPAPAPAPSPQESQQPAPSSSPQESEPASSSQTQVVIPPSLPSPSGGYFSIDDIFTPIDTSDVPDVFTKTPLSSINLPPGVNSDGPIHTNKFYSNMLIDDQKQPVYCLPYRLNYMKDNDFQGIAVSYTNSSQRVSLFLISNFVQK